MKDAPEPIFNALAEQFPAYVIASGRIELKRPLSDPCLEELMGASIALGLTPPKHRADSPSQILECPGDNATGEVPRTSSAATTAPG